MDLRQPDNLEFYENHWSRTSLADDQDVLGKAQQLLAMIPASVRSIADVGCGDGTITRVLAEHYAVTAIDRSARALVRVSAHSPRVTCVQASADALPFGAGQFDLVFSSEMLEHLPDAVLAGATRELQRVAKSWLLLSVPNGENIRRRYLRCAQCAFEFNIYGHLQSLDSAKLECLFAEFEVSASVESGPAEPPTLASIERFRQRFGERWFWWQGAQACCPRCLNNIFNVPKWHPGNRFADKLADWLTDRWISFTDQRVKPWWVTVLMRRGAGQLQGDNL